MGMKMRAALIGCGLAGSKRAVAHPDCQIVICADIIMERAEALAQRLPQAEATTDWQMAVARPDIDLVIVSTVHCALAEITRAAIEAGKHVLVEKPAARSVAEIESLQKKAREKGVAVKVGFNHRHHPAVLQAKKLVDSGALGPLILVRGRYGHGGRIGYEREWRADPGRSGGGELIDQGIHLIDLSRWFLGDFSQVYGTTSTLYWEMPVEDNVFLCLKTPSGQIAWLHASWTEWKNLFSFEIFGKSGKLQIDGLGGSYATERLTLYKMRPEMGPPEAAVWEYPFPDRSFELEFEEFSQAIEQKREPLGNLQDARAALEIVAKIYLK
jgi:predicted dehydrogenase